MLRGNFVLEPVPVLLDVITVVDKIGGSEW
jgi:hypothetical protein